MSIKTSLRELRQAMTELAAGLRRTIEAECMGFSTEAHAVIERRDAVNDPVNGYRYFVQTYFPHYVRHADPSELHVYLFQRLPQVVASPKGCNEAVAAPRGEAKSTLVSQLFVLWCIIRGIKRYPVIVMDSIDQAYPMLEAIKAELVYNPRLQADYPEVCGQGRVWQMGTILTQNDIKVQVAGSGKKLRGLRHGPYRPDLVVLDDIENDENVRKPEQRDKVEAWLKKTVLPLGQAGGKLDVVYIGTILHYDSVLSRTLNNKLWRTARFKALRRWPDNMSLWDTWEALLRNEGEGAATAFYEANQRDMDAGALVSWSARPLVALMTIRARDGHGTFDSEYQNDPVAGDDALFAGKDEAGHDIIKFWVHRMREWIYFGAVDPSLGKAGASRDPSAILVGGYDRLNGVLNVVEAQIRKRLPDKIISDVIALQKAYNCLVWGVESVQFQEFLRTELIKRAQLEGIPVPARSIIPHTDKLLRIESLQPHVANGRILLHADQTTLIEQLRHFPKADHDDGPDALHMLWTLAVSSTPKMEFYSMNSDMSRRASRDWQRDFHQGGW